MAGLKLVWTDSALADLDAIADYIALDNPDAARKVVQRVFDHVEQLAVHPLSGPPIPELGDSRYRQLVEYPCRVFYRHDAEREIVYLLHVMRSERLFRADRIGAADPDQAG